MEQPLRYSNDQYGNDDYAQLERWPGHSPYKSVTPDSSSLIYTSDYGSYSSQESNHSGTNYSHLADCEEALHSPPTTAYELPLPQFPSNMEKRRDKPLPPPRMTSKVQSANKTRFLEPVKEKKISFDDSSLAKCMDDKLNKSEEQVPSFATLPRKKKLSSNASTGTTQSAPQVTWMKEVAQKGEEINRTKSPNVFTNKKPHGILKNKTEDQSKKGDTTGYIKRNTVQRILEQQKSAKNRQSAAGTQSQVYKSMPTLTPRTSTPEIVAQQHKAWEYNFNGNNSTGATAQVIGVFEPSQAGNTHMKQNSGETEFEFPPPPSDHDIHQLMTPGSYAVSNPQSNDFIPLNLACVRGESAPPSANSRTHTDKILKPREHTQKPPVPLRPKKAIIKNNDTTANHQHRIQTNSLVQNPLEMGHTTPIREQRLPSKQTRNDTSATNFGSNAISQPYQRIDTQFSQNTDDIVLPPPPEFQEGNICTALATDQPSYGDYELLSQDSKYDCNVHPTAPPRASTRVHSTNHTNYHHRIPVDQLESRFQDNMKVSSGSKASKPEPSGKGYGYIAQVNGYSHNNNRYSNKHTTYVSHQHQYSTEL